MINNKLLIISAIVVAALTSIQSAHAVTTGFDDGRNQAEFDFNNGGTFAPAICTDEKLIPKQYISHEYCTQYIFGYTSEWEILANTHD